MRIAGPELTPFSFALPASPDATPWSVEPHQVDVSCAGFPVSGVTSSASRNKGRALSAAVVGGTLAATSGVKAWSVLREEHQAQTALDAPEAPAETPAFFPDPGLFLALGAAYFVKQVAFACVGFGLLVAGVKCTSPVDLSRIKASLAGIFSRDKPETRRPPFAVDLDAWIREPDVFRALAREAHEKGRLGDLVLSIESATLDKSYSKSIRYLETLETAWGRFHARRAKADRQTMIKLLARDAGEQAAWRASGLDLGKVFSNMTDEELRALHAAALLNRFLFHSSWEKFIADPFTFDLNADFSSLLESGRRDCNTISTLALHLLKKVGVDGFSVLDFTDHVTLVFKAANGVGVAFNNAASLVPASVARAPVSRYGMTTCPIANESLQEPWQILAADLNDMGSAFFDKAVDPKIDEPGRRIASVKAQKFYRAALAVNPDHALVLTNLADLLIRTEPETLVADLLNLLGRAARVNPGFGRAVQHYLGLLAAVTDDAMALSRAREFLHKSFAAASAIATIAIRFEESRPALSESFSRLALEHPDPLVQSMALTNLGCLAAQTDPKKADGFFRSAVERAVENRQAWMQLARNLARLGRDAEAVATYEAILPFRSDEEAHIRDFSAALSRAGRAEESAAFAKLANKAAAMSN